MATITVGGLKVFISDGNIKIGKIIDEYWLEKKKLGDPKILIDQMKKNKENIDIFAFVQRIPDTTPKYPYYMEWENVAALPIRSYDYWWKNQLKDKTRNMIRKSERNGIEVKRVEYDDKLVEGITCIYNETPLRQGRPFSHYGKKFDAVKKENASFAERSDFIGAYYDDELVGFIKLVYVDHTAGMMQILSKIKYRNKAPNNAMVAKAVDLCDKNDILFLTYSKFIYGKKGMDQIASFKRNNGFLKIDIPKYYVPMNMKGYLALKLRFHKNYMDYLPQKLLAYLLKFRTKYYLKKFNI